jgi:RecB family exonuclease
MPRRLYACTPTRLTTWLDCPRRYRFTYLDRPIPPKGPPWAHNSLGASVHNALAGWHRLPVAARTVDAAAGLVDRGWLTEGYRDERQSETWRSRARDMVARYVATLDPAVDPVGVERTVAVRTPGLALSGRVDRLDLRPAEDEPGEEGLVVVDYKTGRRRLDRGDVRSSLALALYAIASGRVLRRRSRRVELHHLPSGEVHGHEHTEETLDRHLGRAEAIAAEAAAADAAYRAAVEASAGAVPGASSDPAGGVPGPGPAEVAGVAQVAGATDGSGAAEVAERFFPPVVSGACRWCDFLRSCPAGRAAYSPAASWEGLGDLEAG